MRLIGNGVLACFKLGSILEGSYARAQAGKTNHKIGEKLQKSTIQLFNKALRIIRGKA